MKYLLPLILISTLGLAQTGQSALLVYETFNYGVADGTTMNGVTATGQGLQGTYAVSAGTSVYSTTDLNFSSSFASGSGGSVQQTVSGASSILGVQLNAGTHTGTLYGSYLVNFSSLSIDSAGLVSSRLSSTQTSGGANAYFLSNAKTGSSTNRPGVGYNDTATASTGPAITTGTTYLVVSRFTNVGAALSAGTQGVADLWVFTSAGYEDWINNGGTEGALGTYAYATASESVTSGTYSFTNSRFYQIASFTGGGTGTTSSRLDDVRYGTTLGDVMAVVPEPTSAALLGLAVGGMILRRRRK